MEPKLVKIFTDLFNCEIDPKTFDKSSSSWDSLAHLNLIIAIEEEFGVSIPPEDFKQLHSNIETIINYLKNSE
tara:strand:+ start:218 stop:436 length:219 start_codon:yes stop_codon:yes gene_type:complete